MSLRYSDHLTTVNLVDLNWPEAFLLVIACLCATSILEETLRIIRDAMTKKKEEP